jgi:hypothetical protein
MAKHRWFAFMVSLGLALPALTACAAPQSSARNQGGDAAGVTETNPATNVPSSAAASDPGTKQPGEENPGDMLDPTQPGTPKTLRGTTSEGVEANCMLLNADDGKAYLLIGGDRAVITGGGRLEVSVLLQPDMSTTCQQGIPASVLTVRKI